MRPANLDVLVWAYHALHVVPLIASMVEIRAVAELVLCYCLRAAGCDMAAVDQAEPMEIERMEPAGGFGSAVDADVAVFVIGVVQICLPAVVVVVAFVAVVDCECFVRCLRRK